MCVDGLIRANGTCVCMCICTYVVTSYLLQVAMMSCEFFVSCAVLCSDIWAMGCVLYELTTLKHAVSLCTSRHAYTYVYMDWYVRTHICTEMIVHVCM